MFNEGHSVFLLLARRIDICGQKWRTMATDKGATTMIIKLLCVRFGLVVVGGVVGSLAFVYGFGGNYLCRGSWLGFTKSRDAFSNGVDLHLGEEILRIVKVGTVACTASMSMMKIAVYGNMNISSPTEPRKKVC